MSPQDKAGRSAQMMASSRPVEPHHGPPPGKPNPPGGSSGGLGNASFPGGIDCHSNAPEIASAQARNPAAVAAMRRELNLDFVHECAGGIALHCKLVQTFAEIGDVAGTCYSLKRLFAHAKAAHPVFVELRASKEGMAR